MSKKPETGLTVGTGTHEIIEVLNKKIADLKHIEDSVYKTGGNLEGFGDIKQETKIENLIRAFSSVRGREDAYNTAAKELGLKTYPVFTISGGNAEDWKKDILLRKAIIEHKDTLDKLNSYKEKMSKFMTEAEQKENLINEMKTFFGNK